MKKVRNVGVLILAMSVILMPILGIAQAVAKKPLAASATPHSVVLTWTNPTAGTFTGNKVYRATGLCPQTTFNTINTATTPITAYTDNTVSALQTFCYYVTAVNNCPSCVPPVSESLPSNNVSATIPADGNPAPAPPTGLSGVPN